MHTYTSRVHAWGDDLAIRITKSIANAASISEGTRVRVTIKPGRITLRVADEASTLAELLEQFDPEQHAGEAMADGPVGKEAFASNRHT